MADESGVTRNLMGGDPPDAADDKTEERCINIDDDHYRCHKLLILILIHHHLQLLSLLLVLADALQAIAEAMRCADPIPYHTSILTGKLAVHKHIFDILLWELQQHGIGPSKHVTLEEQLAIFLYTSVTNLSIRHVGEHFQRLNGTISNLWIALMLDDANLAEALRLLTAHGISLPALLISVLQTPRFLNEINNLRRHLPSILSAFLAHPLLHDTISQWAANIHTEKMVSSIRALTASSSGWHFSAVGASSKRLADFRMEDLAVSMESNAPELFCLLGSLLSALVKDPTPYTPVPAESLMVDDDEDESWAAADGRHDKNEASPEPVKEDAKTQQRIAILRIKMVLIISILMHSSNQKCNAFESVFGIFLHSCNTPERVINALAQMGVSISVSAINRAVQSLSRETVQTLRTMGQSLVVGYAYDNFDIDFKTRSPTIKKAVDTLTHMTSGTLIQLEHRVTREDLRCSAYLWAWSKLNPSIPSYLRQPAGLSSYIQLHSIHPDAVDAYGFGRRQRWNAYKFLADLMKYGPPYFSQFQGLLQHPEAVDQIPVVKMRQAPARAMDINQSKVSGNLQAIMDLLQQGGVGDPSESQFDIMDMREYVILFHGDLGTGERVQTLMERRSIEDTPWRRFQFVVFVMGLFHLKMACADALWRIFLESKTGREDKTSLMQYVALTRPRETGKIGSDPGFRRMHEVIGHIGVALRLDAWCVEAKRHFPSCNSLEGFAATMPSLELLKSMAREITKSYVADGLNIFEARLQAESMRDKQHENTLLMHQYFLLYEELSWSMNEGDIGRVESLFPSWIYLFKATGKHKYARHMAKFLGDIHFVYPAGLRYAVRYNMLVNPMGKAGKFRGVDWVVESNNCDIKVTFGGHGSNYTKQRVIEESPLIDVYRSCHTSMAQNLSVGSPTTNHAPPDLTKTLERTAIYMKDHRPNEFIKGRSTMYQIPDMLDRGQNLLYSTTGIHEGESDESELLGGIAVESEDLAISDT
ncbi:hypothetical protein M404DRAFT_28360 [Pisolithus tinctorius Marx 270]|uniref:Uncharacterized protein n=1 Tax=Pisolithus tinctorius Marx 270 TaxID=870435 RepID=A0A0C3NLR1_PISTI|nr:hypothetical protein M404DRAFT_28360 [Pisolithus tinctorius Marx 270]